MDYPSAWADTVMKQLKSTNHDWLIIEDKQQNNNSYYSNSPQKENLILFFSLYMSAIIRKF